MSRAISTSTWLFPCHIEKWLWQIKIDIKVKPTWRGSSPSSFVPGKGSDASVALTWQELICMKMMMMLPKMIETEMVLPMLT